jgi:DNA-binding FadR family transcriptional regulator
MQPAEGARGKASRRRQVRQPHVAELLADILRRRILDGELRDGDALPKQEDLIAEFNVSRPSVREALRILESQGLVVVRRGKVGGAVVQLPQAGHAAYMLWLVLRSQQVAPEEISVALRHLESICASLCADRPDRHEQVLPRLQAALEAARDAIDDQVAFTRFSRRFHEELVSCCGNETMILVIGALESLWSAHADAWATRSSVEASSPTAEYRRIGLGDHELLVRLIENGDSESAAQAAWQHREWAPIYNYPDGKPGLVKALLVGDSSRSASRRS